MSTAEQTSLAAVQKRCPQQKKSLYHKVNVHCEQVWILWMGTAWSWTCCTCCCVFRQKEGSL